MKEKKCTPDDFRENEKAACIWYRWRIPYGQSDLEKVWKSYV